jgi:hypothetical protein
MKSDRLSNCNAQTGRLSRNERRARAFRSQFVVFAGLCIFAFVGTAFAQQEKPKVPGLDKILSANQHLMFTGKIKTIDLDHNVLTVGSVEGSDTEIFPIKHNTKVLTADGYRIKVGVLSPGTRIIVYYDQRSDRRNITHIDLFTSEAKKKEPQS